ncbi:hypothetical protein ACEV9L_25680, partial [Vibrio parahaemolyticus]
MFIKTKEILEASESALLGFSINRSLLKPVQRFFVYPLVYLKIGFGDFTKPMAVWSFCSFAALVVLALFSSKIEMPREIFLILMRISVIAIARFGLFRSPDPAVFLSS